MNSTLDSSLFVGIGKESIQEWKLVGDVHATLVRAFIPLNTEALKQFHAGEHMPLMITPPMGRMVYDFGILARMSQTLVELEDPIGEFHACLIMHSNLAQSETLDSVRDVAKVATRLVNHARSGRLDSLAGKTDATPLVELLRQRKNPETTKYGSN